MGQSRIVRLKLFLPLLHPHVRRILSLIPQILNVGFAGLPTFRVLIPLTAWGSGKCA